MTRRARSPLADALRGALEAAADPSRAPAMQAYMKSAMPFRGVGAPERRALVRACLAKHTVSDRESLRAAVLDLWDRARYREERYVAVDLLVLPKHRRWLTFAELSLLEHMITSGAWWDYVDVLAAHGIGQLLRDEPAKMKRTLRRWAASPNLWKRRSALLAQLRFARETDLPLLDELIDENLEHDDFFVQKAIGWALRQYAWVDPKAVQRKVAALGPRLRPLARREALKNVRP